MKKLTCGLIFSLLMTINSAIFAGNNAVEINITGKGPAVDTAALNTVSQVIGSAVANGVVDQYNVTGYGVEGGFSACAQASPFTKSFGAFVNQLRTIKPNRITTAYSLHTVPFCSQETVVCTQEVKLCPDGSYVGRIVPSCEFAQCPGK
jgi:hypothetical protein